MKLRSPVILFLLILIAGPALSQGYTWKRYTVEDGLTSNEVSEITQDENGYLWLLNGTSISRFDGVRFTNYTDKTNFHSMRNMHAITPIGEKIYFTSELATGVLDPKTGSFRYYRNDSLLSYLYFPEKEASMAFNCPLDKNGYRVLTRAHDKKENLKNDTLYYQNKGDMKWVLLPKQYSKKRHFTKVDHYQNTWLLMYDSIKKEQVYLLFNKGQIDHACSSPILNGNVVEDKAHNFWVIGDSIIACYKNNKLIKQYSYPPIRSFNGSLPMIDSKNNVWYSIKEGLLKFNLNGINLYKDPNRHVAEITEVQYDAKGKLHQYIEKKYDNFFTATAIDKYDNIITGERIFDGHQFCNVSFNKEFLSLYEGTKKENLIGLWKCFVDNESNIWYATSAGLFKASPIPFKLSDLTLSFDEYDFKLKASGQGFTKLYTKADVPNKKITIRIFNGDTLKLNEELQLSKTDYVDIYAKDFLDGFAFTFTDRNDFPCLFYFDGKKKTIFRSDNKKSGYYDLFKDDKYLYFRNKEDIIVLSRNSAIKYKGPYISRINNSASFNFKKVLLSNFTELHFKNDGKIDTSVYLKQFRDQTTLTYKINQDHPEKIFVLNESTKEFFIVKNGVVTQLKNNISDSLMQIFKNGFDEGVYFENSFITSSYHLGYHLFNIDEKKKEVTSIKPLTYNKGLPSFYWNYFYYYKGKVIIYNEELEFIKILNYPDLVKENLNDNFVIKANIFLFDQQSKINVFGQNTIGNYINYLGERGYNTVPPKVHFTLLSYSEGDYTHEFMPNVKDLTIPYNVRDINADFQGICLTDGDKLKYKTRLIGLSDEWEERGSEFKYVRYPTLSPGSYTFEVKACNNNGVWNETPATFSFTILPPWNRTWWAYTMYVFAGFAAIRGYLKNRTKKLEKEKKKLEATVEERTAEIVKQKHLIEEKNKEMMDSIRYARRIQSSLLPTEKYISRILGKKKE